MTRRSAVVLACLWCATTAAASDFTPFTLRGYERLHAIPDRAGTFDFDSSLPGIQVAVTWTGAVRPLPPGTRWFVDGVGRTLSQPTFAAAYLDEIEVREGRERWIPMQRELLAALRAEEKPGASIVLDLRHLGAIGLERHVFACVGWRAGKETLRPQACFANALAGVELGESLAEALSRLESIHGPPERTVELENGRMDTVFVVHPETSSYLVVSDAGHGHHSRIFALQLTGPAASCLPVVEGLALGAPAASVRKSFGEPATIQPGRDGVTVWRYSGSPCSVELNRSGLLVSARIQQDALLFSE